MSMAEINQYILAGQVLKGIRHTWADKAEKERTDFFNLIRNRQNQS